MTFCGSLTKNLSPFCDAIKKPGGLDKRTWLGKLEDIDSFTFDSTTNLITAFTFAATKGLITMSGKMEKNNVATTLNVGENYNLRTQSFNFIAYYKTAAELAAIDALIDQEQVCVFVETNAGTIEAWGVNKGTNYNNYGLNVSALDGGSGTAKLDASQYGLTFTGDHQNLQLIFQDTAAVTQGLAADIASVDNLVVGT
jgi:hypothetical protein